MDMIASSRTLPLIAWLLACPALLAAAVFVLPQFKQVYGTPAEGVILLTLLALPMAGAIRILLHKQYTLSARLWLAVSYLAVGLVLAVFAAIFIGCSWAGACF